MKKTFLLITTLLFLTCSEKSPKVTGTLTESDTAAMVGLCYYTNDRPVNGALVTLHDQSTVKKVIVGLPKISSKIRSGTTTTNINGFFYFNSVDTGKYFVEVNDHDTLGALVETEVRPKDDTVYVNAVLKKYGTIKGTVDSTVVSNKKPTTVYIAELGRTVPVDSNGNFIIVLVPVGNGYTIRVVQNDTVIVTVFDTMKVIVSQDSVTQIGVKRNRSPVFAGKSAGMLDTVKIGNTYKDTLHASDPDNDSLKFIFLDSVAGMQLSDSILTFIPTPGDTGKKLISVAVLDGKGGKDTLSWTLVVSGAFRDSTIDMRKGLIAFYPFNGNADDSSGNGLHGTVYGATQTAGRKGTPNSAYKFNGVDNYISVPHNSLLAPSSLSISVWVRIDSYAGTRLGGCPGPYIIFKRTPQAANFEGYKLSVDGPPISFGGMVASCSGKQTDVHTVSACTTGTWYHVTYTADSSSSSTYINGKFEKTTITGYPLCIGTLPLYIGRSGEWFDGYLNGAIDEIRIYNRVLSAKEIDSLYHEGGLPIAVKNRPPVFMQDSASMNSMATVGVVYSDTVQASDPDGDSLTLSLVAGPAGTSFQKGIITWTPSVTDTGRKTVSLKVTDGNNGEATLHWSITVRPAANNPPRFTSQPGDMSLFATVGVLYKDTVHAIDTDHDPLTFTFKDSLAGMQLKDSIISWTPIGNDTGNKSISIRVADGKGGVDSLAWTIRVLPAQVIPPDYLPIVYDSVINGTISPSIEIDKYQFEGRLNDRISLRLLPGSGLIAAVKVLDINGTAIVTKNSPYSGGSILIDTLSLPSTGSYRIQVSSSGGNSTGAYAFIIYSRSKQTTSSPVIQYDQIVSDNITPAITMKSYLLNGKSGDRISFRLSAGSGLIASASILDPNGAVIATKVGPYSGGSILIDTLPLHSTGTFMVQITSSGAYSAGTFTFAAYSWLGQVANSPLIQYQQTVSDSIKPAVVIRSYLFQGAAGENIRVRAQPGSGLIAAIKILDQNLSIITSGVSPYSGGNILLDAVALSSTGIYMVQVTSSGAYSAGTVTLTISRN